MADLAVIFHWPPAAMETMSIAELMGWRARAAKRSQSHDALSKGKK
ncbi:GpE family phage tail protein [Altererythrobacter xixiisoli]|uniref:GpE family phage tail protein n=1 Tax=Croceibacterium xixiisoli TaxID=1476466 RepID=A0A6I4U0G9_9SPHN|nr:GpE family phage tail protein [Croceibacterium xixiisoli]MXP00448.1 GpE family phage tail protein [Croceibacterium xixiisoli]